MEEDWIWQQLDLKEGIDVEAQRRELERLERARCDRLMAEELQGDLSHLPLEREGEIDFPTGDTVDMDVQCALMMSMDRSPPPSCSLTTSHEDPGPSTRRQSTPNTTAHQNNSQCSEDDLTYLPVDSRECWVAIEEDFATPPTSPPPTFLPPPSTSPPPNPLFPLAQSSLTSTSSTYPCTRPNDTSLEVFSDIESDKELAEKLLREELEEQERLEKLSSLDHGLAMELTREETAGDLEATGESIIERVRKQVELLSQSQSDAEIARALQDELVAEQHGTEGGKRGHEEDAVLAQKLQCEEDDKVRQRNSDEQLAYALHNRADTSHDEEIAKKLMEQFDHSSPSARTTTHHLLARQPNWWSPCPNCPADSSRRYHLIEITRGDSEWLQITAAFGDVGFTARRLQRVQNIKLYQRLEFEKQSMQIDKEDGYQINETLLFHTTSAAVNVICSEGLDQRLSRRGRFGSGVYFR